MLSSIPYGTFANYSPRGTSELSIKSRDICGKVKAGRFSLDRTVPYLQKARAAVLEPFLNRSVTLVPVPKSAPLTEGGLWPSLLIAKQLRQFGFAEAVFPVVKRIEAVRKSSTAGWGNRPSVDEHYESLSVERDLWDSERITLVDDVLTKGSTMFACALHLHEAFPHIEIRAFAFFRTQGFIPEIEDLVDPSVGMISFNPVSGTVDRVP